MTAKDTEQLENELKTSDDVKKFLTDNAENFRQFTLAQYLKKLLDEKNLTRAQGRAITFEKISEAIT